jgi:peroxiredoxin
MDHRLSFCSSRRLLVSPMETMPIGSYAPDFELPGVDDAVHHLARYLERFRAVGVVIMGNRCPDVEGYLDRLKQIQRAFEGQGFTLVGINANDERQSPADSFEQMKHFAVEQQLNFPYLKDMTQEVARGFGADHMPQVFLIDQAGRLRYSGAIDDNPQHSAMVQHPYFHTAISQLLAGIEISPALTRSSGCLVEWR